MNDQEKPGAAEFAALSSALQGGLIGHAVLVERLLVAVLSGGHLLLEGAPGLAKTRAVKTLADLLEGSFARIQCTPDLMPGDLTGTPVFRPDTGEFGFVAGPVFNNLVLVDEVNRAPPKVQSALLEAMAEAQVTTGNETRPLPNPFLVVATQNPIEHEGTFPLPEAQLDRFMMKVALQLPNAETERDILDLVEAEQLGGAGLAQVVSLAQLETAKQSVAQIHLAPELRDYIVRIVIATREGRWSEDVEHPISPRGSIALAAGAKARAFLQGRDFALPEDVEALASDILSHRIVLTWRAVSEGRRPRDLIADILGAVEPL